MPGRVRGIVTLVLWYTAAAVVPIGLGAAVWGAAFFRNPQDDLIQPCHDGPLACGGLFPGAGEVLGFLVPFLLVSLVIAVPVHLLLSRRLSPVAAGSLAPVLAWFACLLGLCLIGALGRA